MSQLEIGQMVEVDLFGLSLSGSLPHNARSMATVVDLGPGTIVVRLDLEGRPSAEVTVGPGRICR
jgi:hypothetical protein